MHKLFIELLRISVGSRLAQDSWLMNQECSAAEWLSVLEEAERHAVVGIMVCGLDRLKTCGAKCMESMSQGLMLQWIGEVMQIEQRNALTTKVCGEVVGQMEKDWLRCCVLKGQANHRYYPKGIGNRRNCGDIDIWVEPINSLKFSVESLESVQRISSSRFKVQGAVREVLEYVDAHYERDGLCWLHCNFTDKSGVPVEVHFHPSFFSRPKYNRRFQRYFADMEQCVERVKIDGVEIPAMKIEKDVIYQMNHIYRHLIDEGVGLRQVVDYYYLLVNGSRLMGHGFDKVATMQTVEWLGMKRFAGALMYVLRELLGMPSEYLLCEPVEKDGKFLMEEILLSGNFGHNDPRMGQVASGGYLKSRMSQAWRRFKRNMRFVSSYPGEVIWEPIVRVEHFAWKKLKLWRY